MNKNYLTIFGTAVMTLATGCVTAGTWVNGCYIDGPLCTVCDGMKVVTHAYGTTVCTHCDGTGIEPPEETVVVENVFVDTWCPTPLPPPPPPRWHNQHPRGHREPPHHGGGRHEVRPARPAGGSRPKQATRAKPAPRQARPAAPRGGGRHGGGGRGGRR